MIEPASDPGDTSPEALHEQRWFKSLFDLAPLAYLLLDDKGEVVRCNRSAMALFGLGGQSVQGRPFADRLDSDDARRWPGRLQTALDQGAYGPVEMQIIYRDQNPRWVTCALRRMPSEDGTGVLATLQDVHGQKSVENALKASEEDSKVLLGAIPYGIIEIDAMGYIDKANPAFERLVDTSASDLIGRQVMEVATNTSELKEGITSGSRTGSTLVEMRTAKGEIVPLRMEWALKAGSVDEEDRFLVVCAAADPEDDSSDIHGSKERRGRLQAFWDLSDDMMARHRPDGTFIEVSPAVSSLGHPEPDTLIGIHPASLAQSDEDVAALKEAFQAAEGSVVRWQMGGADGFLRSVETHIAITTGERRKDKLIISSTRDLTQVSDLEERIQSLERDLAEAQRHRGAGQMVGAVAHHYNNLLGNIVGIAELLQGRISDRETSENLGSILSAAERAGDLTRSLLDLTSRDDEARRMVALDRVVEEVVQLFAAGPGPHVRIEAMANRMPVSIRVAQVQQALLHCLLAARDIAGKEGPTLLLERVLDNGFPTGQLSIDCGGEAIRNTFGMMQDEGRSGLSQHPSIQAAKNLLKLNDGSLVIEDESGSPRRLEIRFPLAETGKVAKEPRRKGKGRILVVDDDRVLRLLLSEQLKDLGYVPLLAANGSEALHIFDQERGKIDAVILDLVMPVMDGAETFAALRTRRVNLPILIASGNSTDPRVGPILKMKPASVINKPFRIAPLSQALGKLLTGAE